MNSIFLLLGISFFMSDYQTKVRVLQLDKVLGDAKKIQKIIIAGYGDSTMLYKTEYSNQIQSVDSRHRLVSEQFRKSLIEKNYMKDSDMAGFWPKKGDSVLMLVNGVGKTEVFAKKTNGKYRFWDPNSIPFSNSIFVFPSSPPYYALVSCRQYLESRQEYMSCEDGCLVDISAVKEK